MAENDKRNRFNHLLTLAIIWLVGAAVDRIWFAIDHVIPGWDQAGHLTGALTFRQALQAPEWFSGEWWTSFWMISPKFPPLTYISTVPFLNIFGTGTDQSTLINLLFSAILLGSIYGLAIQLFNPQVGLWAAGLCLLLPVLYQVRLDFLLDYPLTALVTLSFWCLTVWRTRGQRDKGTRGFGTSSSVNPQFPIRLLAIDFFWVVAFGISFGLALLTKQTALFFLLVPILWVGIESILNRAWRRLLELVGGLLLSIWVCGSWYRTNWLLILTSSKRATIDSAMIKGEAPLNSLDAWTFYGKHLPEMVSWPLLLVPIVGLLLYWGRVVIRKDGKMGRWGENSPSAPLMWLAGFWVGAYLLSSLNINKDLRYVAPYLPVVSLFLADGLTRWKGRWGGHIRWSTVGLAGLLMFLNISNLGGIVGSQLTQTLTPNAQHYPDIGPQWPHQQVIAEIINTEPYLCSTLGVLPSTGKINQHSFNYYGALKDFQVYGRQVGTRRQQISQDVRSLSWFLSKTGDQGSVSLETEAAIVQAVEQSPDFQLHKTWNLPDGSILKLHHSRVPPVQVQPITSARLPVQLKHVILPAQTPPGVPVPVTYEWSGSWEQLQSGIVILTWQAKETGNKGTVALRRDSIGHEGLTNFPPLSSLPNPQSPISKMRWLHDHGIGMGALPSNLHISPVAAFQVIEHTAMLPSTNILPGTYTLTATYLNRKTGEAYPISVPPVTLKIAPASLATPAPELDLVTQLQTLSAGLPKGRDGLAPIFAEIGRINQYDPIQDYLVQTQQALEYRLRQEPQNREWAYNLALSIVLQRQVSSALAALERVTQLDPQNPYAYAYLAFVYLYDWQPKAALKALKPALDLNPNLPELKALKGVAALMQGNFLQAWHTYQELNSKSSKSRV